PAPAGRLSHPPPRSLHDALRVLFHRLVPRPSRASSVKLGHPQRSDSIPKSVRSSSAAATTSRKIAPEPRSCTRGVFLPPAPPRRDRKSTRLNSSHLGIPYAVLCF